MDLLKYATLNDTIECNVTTPCKQTIRLSLKTPRSVAYANKLLADKSSGWRLAKVDTVKEL